MTQLKGSMSNIEKIRQEIERQRSFIEGLFIEGDNNFYDGQDDAYNHLLTFIDSLPEETCKGSPLPEDTVLFHKGVEEGRRLEKDDLALTWEDMANIDAIILDVNNEFAVDYSKEIDRQKFYEEVLKRLKEAKK